MRKVGRLLCGGILFFCLFLAIIPAYALFSTHLKKASPAPSKRSVILASSLSDASPAFPVSGDEEVLVQEIRLSVAELVIDVGYMEQLMSSIFPPSATDRVVRWLSENESVATVDSTGLVCGVSAGTTNITVVAADGEREATCKVTVVAMESAGEPSGCGTSNGLSLWPFISAPLAFRGRDARRRRYPERRAS